MSIESSCSSCKFFRGRENDQWGECRRYPRRINPDSLSTLDFPGTLDSDWCGEWKLKKVIHAEPVVVQEQKRPIAITWSVNKLQEVDWILALLHLKGEMLVDVVSQSKAKSAVSNVYSEESWSWLQKLVSQDTWDLFNICLRFQYSFPKLRMVDCEDEFWRDVPNLVRAVIALCRKDEVTLNSFGMALKGEEAQRYASEGQVAANVLAPEFRGYWNMRLRLVPGSHFETHLPTGILGVAVSRLDPLFLLARGTWIVGRHP